MTSHPKWGYCSRDCQGERAVPSSKYNLANDLYSNVWEENLYDLGSYVAGYFYTYNPPNISYYGFVNRLFMLLGNKEYSTVMGHYLQEFNVYLHEKGQFWPRPGMASIGQTEGIRIKKGVELIGQFEYDKVKQLNIDNKYCTNKKEYSFTTCIMDYMEKMTNCRLNWTLANHSKDNCNKNFNLEKYQAFFDFMKLDDCSSLDRAFASTPKCPH